MTDSVINTVIAHLVDRSAEGAANIVEALANRIGSDAVRKHLDAYDAVRAEADAAEQKKFGLRLFSKWMK